MYFFLDYDDAVWNFNITDIMCHSFNIVILLAFLLSNIMNFKCFDNLRFKNEIPATVIANLMVTK